MNPKDQQDADMEPEPTVEERAEAEALARALEASGAAAPPDDVLAAAALLRHAQRAQDPGEPARAAASIAAAEARVLAAVDRRRPRRRRWLLPALVVPATAAAAALIVTVMPATRSYLSPVASSPGAPVIPKPPAKLLEAQANAAHAGGDLSALDRQMRDYRRAYYAALGGGDEEEP
jgi:hypothetical protein